MAEAVMLPGQEGSCQADSCNSDMTEQSVWHQKSRICDKHMSGMFLKQGRPQQFCQQCGRSHNLDAFDEGRRSCRTQLAKHAARLVQIFAALWHPQPFACMCLSALALVAQLVWLAV